MIQRIVITALIFLSVPIWGRAAMTSPHFQISTSVMSGGSGMTSSPGYKANSVFGQPTPLMLLDNHPLSASFILYPGYMYTLPVSCFGDFNLDGDVDGQDLQIFMTGYPGSFSHDDLIQFASEFGKDNCR
ncbi:MAG: hypothetical protein WC836_19970 [Desulfobacula sp.]